jgi:hypothetical protein
MNDIIDEVKNVIKQFTECGICGKKIKSSTGSNTCHFCDIRVCNKCKMGNICLNCVKKLPLEVVENINKLRKRRNISTILFVLGFLVLLMLPILQQIIIPIIIAGCSLIGTGFIAYFILHILMWYKIEKTEENLGKNT